MQIKHQEPEPGQELVWDCPRPPRVEPTKKRIRAIVGKDHPAFYASRVDECCVDEERVQPQAGDFYSGWITSDIVGLFKGAPGAWGW
jgi:hypothetical protein